MRWLRMTLIALGILLLIVAAGLAFILNQPERLQKPVERYVSSLLDREFSIAGEFEVDLGKIITLRATQVRIANPDWVTDSDFLNVAEVQASVDLESVLSDTVVLPAVTVRDAVLTLIQDSERGNNWSFGEADQEPDSEESSRLGFVIQNIDVTGSSLSFASPAVDAPVLLEIGTLTQRPRDDGLLDARLSGKLGGKNISAAGKLGPFDNLIAGSDVQLDLTGQFDSLNVAANGLIDDLADPQQPSLTFSLNGPDVQDLIEMLNLGRQGVGDVDLTGELLPDSEGVSLEIHGNIGRAQIDLSARSARLLSVENGSIDFDLAAPNLGRMLALAGVEDAPAEAFKLTGRVQRSGSVLTIESVALDFADARFDLVGKVDRFPDLDGAKLTLDIDGNNIAKFRQILGLPGVADGPFKLRGIVTINPEGSEVLDVQLDTQLLRMSIAGPIGDPPDYLGTRLKIAASGDNFAKLADAMAIPNQSPVSFEISSEVEVTGPGMKTSETTQLRLGEQRLQLEGLIGLKPLDSDTDVRFRAYGTSTAKLAELLQAQTGIADRPYDISGRLRVLESGYQLDKVRGEIGTAKLELSGLISRADELIGSKLRFSTAGPDLEELLADTDAFDVPKGPFDIAGSIERRRDTIRVRDFYARGGRASISADADVGWPLGANSSGQFNVTAEGPDLAAILPEFEAFKPDPEAFAVSAEGSWRGTRWTIKNLVASLADASLSGSGVFSQPPDMSDTDISFTLAVPDLARLGIIGGQRLPSLPLDFQTRFAGSPNLFVMENLNGRLGESIFNGDLKVDISSEVPDLDLNLSGPFIDLKPFLDDPSQESVKTEAQQSKDDGDGLVIPNIPLPLEQMRRLNLDLDLDFERVRFRNISLLDVHVDGALKDGALSVQKFAASGINRGQLHGNLNLAPGPGGAALDFSIDGKDMRLNLFGEPEDRLDLLPTGDLDASMSSRGDTIRELAAALNGKLRAEVRGGRLPNSGLDFITGDFLDQVVNTINPYAQEEEYTPVSCIAVILTATDGVLETVPAAVFQSDKLTIVAQGTLDLSREQQRIEFRSSPRKGISISLGEIINPFMMVSGTFSKPQLALDVKSGTQAVFTLGLSIVAKAFWDRLSRAEDPCAAAIEQADQL